MPACYILEPVGMWVLAGALLGIPDISAPFWTFSLPSKTSLLVVATCPVQRAWLSGMAGGSRDWTVFWTNPPESSTAGFCCSPVNSQPQGWRDDPDSYLWLPAWAHGSCFFWHSLIGSESHLACCVSVGMGLHPACFRLSGAWLSPHAPSTEPCV